MDNQHGVYASFRSPNGLLISSSRGDWALVREDLEVIFGADWVERTLEEMKGEEDNVIPFPSAGPSPMAVEPTASEVAAALGGTAGEPMGPEPVQAAPAQAGEHAFSACEECGTLKDRWQAGGISRGGKKYPGFFGCPNFRNHRR